MLDELNPKKPDFSRSGFLYLKIHVHLPVVKEIKISYAHRLLGHCFIIITV